MHVFGGCGYADRVTRLGTIGCYLRPAAVGHWTEPAFQTNAHTSASRSSPRLLRSRGGRECGGRLCGRATRLRKDGCYCVNPRGYQSLKSAGTTVAGSLTPVRPQRDRLQTHIRLFGINVHVPSAPGCVNPGATEARTLNLKPINHHPSPITHQPSSIIHHPSFKACILFYTTQITTNNIAEFGIIQCIVLSKSNTYMYREIYENKRAGIIREYSDIGNGKCNKRNWRSCDNSLAENS